jgi:ankyrin repeat protein
LFVIVPLVIVAAFTNALSDRFFPAYSLPTAAAMGSVAEVHNLLSAGADIEARGQNALPALYEAAAAGHVDVVQLLLDHGARADGTGGNNMTPLALAAARDQAAAMEVLIKAGAKPDGPSGTVPPLYESVMFGNLNAVKTLLVHGADPNIPYKAGITPLMCVSQHVARARAATMAQIVAALIDAGAKVNARSKGGLTALHFAARYSEPEIAELLISVGAQVNARDPKGATPLHYASQKGSEEMIQVLLSAGADRNAKNKAGETPVQIAKTPDIAKLLTYQP